ncbi:MAG: ABC transporter permease [Promethearchaeia archaeon]|nr:MAG: ABC transporter permease [Candidatus Lokiarchaeia archaeon]
MTQNNSNTSDNKKKFCSWKKFLFKPDLPKNNPTDIALIKNQAKGKVWVEYLKFFLIPTYQSDSFSALETALIEENSRRSTFRKMLTPLTIIGSLIIIFMVFLAVFAPWLSPYTYKQLSLSQFPGAYAPPSPEHFLGTTLYGRDILGRIIYGARESLTLGISAILISYVFGTIFGLIAAYFGGKVDTIIMRIFDLLMTLPGLVIVLLFGAIFGRTMNVYMISFGILMIPENARLIRSQVLIVKQCQYVEAARISGAKDFRIMFKHILPNSIAPMIISASFSMGATILGITALTFLGMGEPNVVEWGGDVNLGKSMVFQAPWAFFWPGFFIIITVFGFILLGDGLVDVFNPRNTTEN